MCSTAQQLVGQDMQGQALKWQLRLGAIFSVNGQQMSARKDKVLVFKFVKFKFEKNNNNNTRFPRKPSAQ
jgi:hypothetical protein